jgi:hypothetical protein
MEQREIIAMEIDNFILYFTSSDSERKQMQRAAQDYMEEVYEDPDTPALPRATARILGIEH